MSINTTLKTFNMMKKFFPLIVLFTILCSPLSVWAQSFIVTNVEFGPSYTEEMQDYVLKKDLGTQIDLQFFDNKVKIIMWDDGRETFDLYNKINSTKYEINFDDLRYKINYSAVLELNTIISYIRSFTLTTYQNGKLQTKITAKRK